MSEPLSSGEIEDVLSSIRRLVSDDLRPSARASAPPKPVEEADKLILTPSLRVVAPDPEGKAAVDEITLRAPLPDFTMPDAALPDPALPEHGRDDPPAADAPGHSAEAVAPDAPASDHFPEQAVSAAEANPDLTRLVISIGSAVDEHSGDWEPETGVVDFPDTAWRTPDWVQEAEVLADPAVIPLPIPDDVLSPQDLAANDAAEAAAVAEIQAAASRQSANGQSQPDPAGPDADLFAAEEGLFDETVLRDLVRDLIREELAGTLGERITRNVRKLVRAEINRALTARDFD